MNIIYKSYNSMVHFYSLGDIAKIKNGKDYKHLHEGKIPVYGSGGIMTYVNEYIYDKPSVLIPRKGSLNKLYYTEEAFWNVDTVFYTEINTSLICPKFLYYYLQTQHLEKLNNAGGVPSLTQTTLYKIQIPVPPLEIQEEIVRILDKFTDLTAELQSELEAELQGRIQQYDFYRNRLLTYPDKNQKGETSPNGSTHNSAIAKGDIELLPLSELGTFIRGKRFVHADVVENGYPCIHYGEMYTYYGIKANKVRTTINPDIISKLRFAEKGDVVIVAAGENKDDIGVGVAWLGEEKPAIHDACFIFRQNGKLDPVYLSHFLRSNVYHKQILRHVVEAKICSIPSAKIGTAIIPVPSLDEQKRIANILDKFDSLVHDLKQGLPAEIEALQQQYEYYRDKLLTFKRAI